MPHQDALLAQYRTMQDILQVPVKTYCWIKAPVIPSARCIINLPKLASCKQRSFLLSFCYLIWMNSLGTGGTLGLCFGEILSFVFWSQEKIMWIFPFLPSVIQWEWHISLRVWKSLLYAIVRFYSMDILLLAPLKCRYLVSVQNKLIVNMILFLSSTCRNWNK